MPERRRHQRNAITFPATLTITGASPAERGVCRDLSLGGLYLVTTARPPAGARLELTATFPGSQAPVILEVTVRWTGHDGLGLQFGAVGEQQRAAIANALRLAVPTRSVPPGAGRRSLALVAGLAGGLVVSLALGFVVVRYGPALVSRFEHDPVSPAAIPATVASSAEIRPDRPAKPASVAPAVSIAAAAASASAVPVALAPAAPAATPPLPAAAASTAPSAPATQAPAPPTAATAADSSPCMAAMLPPDTFKTPPDLTFVCTEPDPRKAAQRMRVKVVVGSGGKLTEGTNEWSRLGWYELAVLGVLRRSCCPAPATFELPEPSSGCDALAPLLDRLGDAVKARTGVDEVVKAFEQAAVCAHAARTGAYRYPAGPFSGSQVAFSAFLSRNVR